MKRYIIKLEKTVCGDNLYLADFDGDPGRTFLQAFSKKFETKEKAEKELAKVRLKYKRKFPDAEVIMEDL